MKKLFVTCLSAITLFGVAGCGTASYSDKVLPADEGTTLHVCSQWAEWKGTEENKMTATSVKAVSEFSKELADKLAGKSLKYLYTINVTIPSTEAGWKAKYVKPDGTEVEVDGNLCIKAQECGWDATLQMYTEGQWIPNAGDKGKPANVEALTDNLFFPAWQAQPDEHGLSWADNPVVTSGAGSYRFVVARYTALSAPGVVGYGFGLVPLQLK